jgi:hypothetical protein
MSQNMSQAAVIRQWQNLVSAIGDNAGDLPHLASRFTRLQDILAEAILVEQAAARPKTPLPELAE